MKSHAPASTAEAITPASSAASSPSRRPRGLELLGKELALEAAEEEAGLLSPFTSPFTSVRALALALEEGEEGGQQRQQQGEDGASDGGSSSSSSSGSGSSGGTPEEPTLPGLPSEVPAPSAALAEDTATLSLLDGVAQSLAQEQAEQQQQQQQQQLPSPPTAHGSSRLSVGEDGFVTSPPVPLLPATAGGGRPPVPVVAKPAKRRFSLPSLSLAASSSSGQSTPKSGAAGSSSGGIGSAGLTLEALKAKLSGRGASAAAAVEGADGTGAGAAATTPTTPVTATEAGTLGKKAAAGAATDEDEALLIHQSAQRLGLDVSGLRKALLVRVLGVEPVPTAAGSNSGNGGSRHRHRSASLGMMPAGWLKRGRGSPTVSPAAAAPMSDPSTAGTGAAAVASYMVVLWVRDVESGDEWYQRKSPRDLLSLHAVVSALSGDAAWAPPREEAFPLLPGGGGGGGGKRSKGHGGSSISGTGAVALSLEKQARLERYLRALAAADPSSLAGAAFEAAKVLQAFLGALERVDALAACEARADERSHASRLVQLQGLALLRDAGNGYAGRLEGFVREAQGCDVQRTELLQAYASFLGDLAREMVDAHGPRLRAPLTGGLLVGAGIAGSAPWGKDPEELDLFCVSALWRLLEAESFLPLRLRLYERVTRETDAAQERTLVDKCARFKVRGR